MTRGGARVGAGRKRRPEASMQPPAILPNVQRSGAGYAARLTFAGRSRYLGTFATEDAAACAVQRAREAVERFRNEWALFP